jgi:phosphatidylserine/phosphatidylglycerophosphate/cardiolipin synthase-like enzyme
VTKIIAKPYTSPSLVLLAMDWPNGDSHNNFLGFAIRRTPGFQDNKTGLFSDHSWLPNRIGFNGPPPTGRPDPPSNEAPVQRFLWWDARLDGLKVGSKLRYEISPIIGKPNELNLIQADTAAVDVILPEHIEFGIGTWFNRAVMSSQAFSRILDAMGIPKDQKPSDEDALKLRTWLANGMERPLPNFIGSTPSIVGAIYHLTDLLWVIPAMESAMTESSIGLVYDAKVEKDKKTGELKANPNEIAINTLKDVQFFPRNKTNIMHNKFLVSGERLLSTAGQKPMELTCGSTNYTTEGLTSQANLLHTFASDELAELYLERFQLLKKNPSRAITAKETGWSHTVSIGDAGVRVFFSPEPGRPHISDSLSIETIVQAIHGAHSSVIFCLFTPTDEKLRQACFTIGDAGKMMFGIVNHIQRNEPDISPSASGSIPADKLAALEIYHRSKDKKDVIGAEFFNAEAVPEGFEPEINIFPGEKPPDYPPVIIHHKFIVIDAETESPVIYTGSANMSGNSVFNNDENLLEIKGSPRLAQIYLAEFLRLYEHYRARARFIDYLRRGGSASASGLELQKDRKWADKHYTPGTPEYKARLRMLAV